MTSMTLTEFNRNPSQVVRMMERSPRTVIQVTKRGTPLFQVSGLLADDPVSKLVSAQLAKPPVNASRTPIDYKDGAVPAGVDLLGDLMTDRGRLV